MRQRVSFFFSQTIANKHAVLNAETIDCSGWAAKLHCHVPHVLRVPHGALKGSTDGSCRDDAESLILRIRMVGLT